MDESFTVPLPLEGMTLATVLKTLTERAQAECLQKGEDALRNPEGPVHPRRGIDCLQWRKETRSHLPVYSSNRLNCRVCWDVSKAITGKGMEKKTGVVCSGCGGVPLCFQPGDSKGSHNCFAIFHSSAFDQFVD